MDLAGKKILVTGGAGFLGRSRVCAGRSRCRGARRAAPRGGRLHRPERDARTCGRPASGRDRALAAEVGGIGANRANPGRYFFANMAMGLPLIEAARIIAVGKFVQVGTVCAYPKFAPVHFRENDLWKGYPEETNAPYGVAKKALLVMLRAYREQYGINGIYLLR